MQKESCDRWQELEKTRKKSDAKSLETGIVRLRSTRRSDRSREWRDRTGAQGRFIAGIAGIESFEYIKRNGKKKEQIKQRENNEEGKKIY